MAQREKKSEKHNEVETSFDELRKPKKRLLDDAGLVLFIMLALSIVIHILSGVQLPTGGRSRLNDLATKPKDEVKIRIVQKPTEEWQNQKILETPQTKTEKPTVPSRLGQVDHATEKETKVTKPRTPEKALDPGQAGKPDVVTDPKPGEKPAAEQKPQVAAQPKPDKNPLTSPKGSVKINPGKDRKSYEALLPTQASDLAGQMNAGYQDFIDDQIEEGDRVDLNTTEYRFIGYMTSMRKAIELVWNYPMEASQRGLQGEVGLEFAIHKDGKASRIRVIRSSGYDVLDNAIVEAIKLASPFSPLPPGMNKNRLVITGSFRYVLNTFGGH